MREKLFPLAATILLVVIAGLLTVQTFYPVGRYEYRTLDSSFPSVFDTRTGKSYIFYGQGKVVTLDIQGLAHQSGAAAPKKTEPLFGPEWRDWLVYAMLGVFFLVGVFVRLIYGGLRWLLLRFR